MNPNLQTQIWDPTRLQWVQIDGGELASMAVAMQTLIELRVQTAYLYGIASGNTVDEQPEALRADALNDPTLFRQG